MKEIPYFCLTWWFLDIDNAKSIQRRFERILNIHGRVSVADFYDWVDLLSPVSPDRFVQMSHYGWRNSDCIHITEKENGSAILTLSEPIDLNEEDEHEHCTNADGNR